MREGVRRGGRGSQTASLLGMRPAPKTSGARTGQARAIQRFSAASLEAVTAGTGRHGGEPKVDVGRTHHPKTDVVVTVVRMVVVAVAGARVVLIVDPGAAAQHPRLGAGLPCRDEPAREG